MSVYCILSGPISVKQVGLVSVWRLQVNNPRLPIRAIPTIVHTTFPVVYHHQLMSVPAQLVVSIRQAHRNLSAARRAARFCYPPSRNLPLKPWSYSHSLLKLMKLLLLCQIQKLSPICAGVDNKKLCSEDYSSDVFIAISDQFVNLSVRIDNYQPNLAYWNIFYLFVFRRNYPLT